MTVKDMIPEYKRNLDRLRQRRLDLLREREFEVSNLDAVGDTSKEGDNGDHTGNP